VTPKELRALAMDCEAGTCGPSWPTAICTALRDHADLCEALQEITADDVRILSRGQFFDADCVLAWWRARKGDL